MRKAITAIVFQSILAAQSDLKALYESRKWAELYKATRAKNDAEIKQHAAIQAGTSDRTWVDATLTRLGVIA